MVASTAQSYSLNFPETDPLTTLDYDAKSRIWVLTFLAKDSPDNRLTHAFILKGLLPALDHVERQWDAITDDGSADGGAALITTCLTDPKSKIYSNGLDLEKAMKDPDFFDEVLFKLYEKLLTFPIPTIASIGGHAFAGGFGLVAAHDYRVMNGARGYLCMNEIDFGAQIPAGLMASITSKVASPTVTRKIFLEGHRLSATEAKQDGVVDLVATAEEGYEGPAGTLKLAKELAEKVKVKASRDAWGSQKLVLYAPQIAILRTKHEHYMAKL
ncbi:ClpP/crotonase [Violaceomyces palustris]|uniref:ClpP/crotonase n=1 Tax=Violaceomyces palustris TaxID=1673888 RepID=A0ACD0P875_9BASI|nr:ClpP/crotonase [Violaceomyces palustris]